MPGPDSSGQSQFLNKHLGTGLKLFSRMVGGAELRHGPLEPGLIYRRVGLFVATWRPGRRGVKRAGTDSIRRRWPVLRHWLRRHFMDTTDFRIAPAARVDVTPATSARFTPIRWFDGSCALTILSRRAAAISVRTGRLDVAPGRRRPARRADTAPGTDLARRLAGAARAASADVASA